jgi:8-oxo-dGTP diphosphatase
MRAVVVGAAVLRDARLLAARRTAPPELAGRWELPGGKVEPGERRTDALERELREELGCDVEVTGWLSGEAPIGDSHVLQVATAVLVRGEPHPHDHDQVRWLGADELDDVDWLEPDRPFLPELRELLLARASLSGGGSHRAVFFDEEHARAAAERLRSDGFDARIERERLAGEDDDEDHPWAVVTEAPLPAVELLVDAYDGWLDTEELGPSGRSGLPSPLPLPTQPRRARHRPHS